MPKVSSKKFVIRGELKEFKIYYNSKRKFFFKDFPEEIFLTAKNNNVYEFRAKGFESEKELIEYFEELIASYHEIISKCRKVIVYDISAPKTFQELDEVPKEISEKLGYAGGDNGDFGFVINWRVFFEKEDNGKNFFTVNEDGSVGWKESVNEKQSIVIEHTPEREEFFKRMESTMKNLFLKVLFTMMDADQFISLMDKGQNLLPVASK